MFNNTQSLEYIEDTQLNSSQYHQTISGLKENPEQFWVFWLTMEKRVFNYCFFRLTKNHHDAEDLCRDTMLKAYENLDKAKDNSNIAGWLFQLARHTFFDQMRKRKTLNKYQIILLSDSQNKNSVNEESELLTKEFNINIITFIKGLFEELPEMNRLITLDYFFNDKSYKQLSFEHNQTESNIRKIIFRSKKKLAPDVFKFINKSGT